MKRSSNLYHNLSLPQEKIREFCQHNHICKFSLFGSALRSDFNLSSDIDVLVEFDPGYRVGLMRMARMENELSELLGRKADMRTPGELSRYFRQEVIDSAVVQYVQR